MKKLPFRILAICACFISVTASAMVHYVNVNSVSATAPYSDWLTAANSIQEAIDVATNGDQILVTNGIYVSGGRVVYGALTNRVVIDKVLKVQSVNGPEVTIILGQLPDFTNGEISIRCVYMTNGATLAGFTLKGGSSRSEGDPFEVFGGALWCEEDSNILVTNCIITESTAGGYEGGGAYCYHIDVDYAHCATLNNCEITYNNATYGGGASGFILTNCMLTGNVASEGGAVAACALHDCVLLDNQGFDGGGANTADLFNCSLIGNLGRRNGGGAESCNLYGCTLSGNIAGNGGGADRSFLYACKLNGNTATNTGTGAQNQGGGAFLSTLSRCIITNNLAVVGGGVGTCNLAECELAYNGAIFRSGGADGSLLTNCTIVSNTSTGTCGGVGGGSALKNCITYYNNGGSPNYGSDDALSNCCAWPLPADGLDNFTAEPLFSDLSHGDFHLQSNSPCINAGNNAYVIDGDDLDANVRIRGGTVDVGAYEFQSPTSLLSFAWAEQYGLPTDGSADFLDTDGDGMNNWQEWKAGTIPTNSWSALRLLSPSNSVIGLAISWQSVTNRTYFLQRATNFNGQLTFSSLQSDIVGEPGVTTFFDKSATNGPYFYRVGIQ